MTTEIQNYIQKQINLQLVEARNAGYSKNVMDNIEKKVVGYFEALIENVSMIEEKKINDELFEVLLNPVNTVTRGLFELVTGIKLGGKRKTYEQLNSFFPEYKKDKDAIKNEEIENTAIKKALEAEYQKEYFGTRFNIDELSPMQIGKLKATLERVWNFDDEGIMTMKAYIEKYAVRKTTTDNMHKWRRAKFNKMNCAEQEAYEQKLKNGISYYVVEENDNMVEVPKIIYDSLTF